MEGHAFILAMHLLCISLLTLPGGQPLQGLLYFARAGLATIWSTISVSLWGPAAGLPPVPCLCAAAATNFGGYWCPLLLFTSYVMEHRWPLRTSNGLLYWFVCGILSLVHSCHCRGDFIFTPDCISGFTNSFEALIWICLKAVLGAD